MIKSVVNSEVFELIERLRQINAKAEALAAHQHDLREQLAIAEGLARELHQRIREEQQELGGEG